MTELPRYLFALRNGGYRITAQRRAICAFLAETDLHPTAAQVYQAVQQTHPNVSRATVYNTLSALKQLGVIVEMSTGDDHTHYETNNDPHINLVCLTCRQVFDYHEQALDEAWRNQIVANTGFLPVAAKSELYGYCARCRSQTKTEQVP